MHSGSPLTPRKISSLLIKSWVLLLPTASSSPFQFDLKERRRELVPGTLREGFGLSVTLKYVANLELCGDVWIPKASLVFGGFLLLSSTNSGWHSHALAQCAACCWSYTEVPGSLCAFHGMRCCLWPLASAPGVGCLRAKLQPVCTPPYGLSCLAPQFIKEETQTGEDIAGECGPVLLALTPVLARNWISVLEKIPSSEGVLLQPEVEEKTEEKTTTAFRGREMQKGPVLRALNHHF